MCGDLLRNLTLGRELSPRMNHLFPSPIDRGRDRPSALSPARPPSRLTRLACRCNHTGPRSTTGLEQQIQGLGLVNPDPWLQSSAPYKFAIEAIFQYEHAVATAARTRKGVGLNFLALPVYDQKFSSSCTSGVRYHFVRK